MHKGRQVVFWLLLLALPLAVAAVIVPLAWQYVRVTLQPAVVAYLATHLSETEKQAIHRQLQDGAGGLFMEIPEPLVGRVASPAFQGDYKEAPVTINAAGMRSEKMFPPKSADAFRIVCLGDSFVFGTGVPEQTRFCNQIETFYREHNIAVNGKRIETLAVGLPSYTMIQEASYLVARLTAYAPDVVILVSVHNDIMDNVGVTSFGALTTEYSIEQRAWGSAVFSNQAGIPFGKTYYTALTTDLSPEARQRWDNAFAAVRQLADAHSGRDGKLLLSVLQMPARHNQYFYELYKQYAKALGLPYVMVDYWQGKKTRLPDDGHPNAYGHALIAAQYVHSLSRLGWVPVPEAQLPIPDAFTEDPVSPPPDPALLLQERERFVAEHLAARLDFSAMGEDAYGALLGGFFPESSDGLPGVGSVPWASVRAGFLLKAPSVSTAALTLVLQLPDRAELFPFSLVVSVDGVHAGEQTWALEHQGKVVTVSLPVTPRQAAVEVLLETPRYFADLQDHRMKSYRVLSASIE